MLLLLEKELELHHRKAEWFYSALCQHTEEAKSDETVATLCFNFQQNLPCPVIPVGELFYARQLWLFNFCIHDCSRNTGTMYCWDETTAKRGSNEVASCLFHYIKHIIPDGVKVLHLFCDGCGGQNKNYTIIWFLHTLVAQGYFDCIQHVLPVRGHSFLPCDRDFAAIEVKKRKVENLYVPEQWFPIIEEARVQNKFEVVKVDQDMIFNFNDHLAPFYKKNMKSGRQSLRVRDARVFEYDRNHVHVKYSMSPIEAPIEFDIKKPTSGLVTMPMEPMFDSPLPIRHAKLNDLQKLSEKYIPTAYKSFYENLIADLSMDTEDH